MKKVTILCNDFSEFNLEASFKRAFEYQGCKVDVIAFNRILGAYVKLGKLGKMVDRFLPIEAWTKKAGREISLSIKNTDPDLILITGGTTLHLGTLAFIKTYTKAKILYLWQDPIINLPSNLLDFNSLFDGVASFNEKYINTFQAMGFSNVFWLPLAADDAIHEINNDIDQMDQDLCFIGGWRPEREYYLDKIISQFPDLEVKIWGTDWKGNCKSKNVIAKTQTNPVRGKEFAEIIDRSLISLNVIDDAGYPAANMRFFEIPMAGGLQLSSQCPEFIDDYHDGEHLFYFNDEKELFEKIQFCLNNRDKLGAIRDNGKKLTKDKHLYLHRSKEILNRLGI